MPGFQASRTIEMEAEIDDPKEFQKYFKQLNFNEGEIDSFLTEQLAEVEEGFSNLVYNECFDSLISRSIGCKARCPGCGLKCELPVKLDSEKEHQHCSQYHLPMAFYGWPRDHELHPHLSMCYQRWGEKVLYRDDEDFSSPKEFFSAEAPNWYNDLHEKSKIGEACSEYYPLEAHRRAWMTVRYPLIRHFGLRDLQSYHTGIYPMDIVSVPNDYEVVWDS